jgi:hypothetical protein
VAELRTRRRRHAHRAAPVAVVAVPAVANAQVAARAEAEARVADLTDDFTFDDAVLQAQDCASLSGRAAGARLGNPSWRNESRMVGKVPHP